MSPGPGFRFDCHVHSHHSKDARGTVLELAQAAQAAGMHGFALTDHDTIAGHTEIQEAREKTGMLIVPGIEVTTAEGHLLALGVSQEVPRGLGFLETRDLVEAQGGLVVPAHPLRLISGMGPTALHRHTDDGAIVAIEALNARERRLVQENTRQLVSELGVSPLGGSDAHWIRDIGTAYTVFPDPPVTVDDVLDRIRRGQCIVGGRHTARAKVWGHSLSLATGPLRRRLLARRKK